MPYGLYISAEGALAQTRRLEVVANNLANVDTVGFRRDVGMFQARLAEETETGRDYPGSRSINDLGGGVTFQASLTDFTAGPLKRTNNPTDLALRGDGFFLVRDGNEELLTRAGDFAIGPGGALLTQQGFPVLSEAGTPVVIDQDSGPWMLTPDGGVAQAGGVTYLAIVRPNDLRELTKVGQNLYRPAGRPAAVDVSKRQVVSGYLEQSAIKPTTEMMQMIETSRAVEANANMIRTQDQMLGTLVTRILRTNG